MAMRSRRDEYSDATRRAVLASATSLFATKGYAATSLDEVGADARVTKGAVYHHFASKGDLFLAVSDELEEQTSAQIVAASSGKDSAWDATVAGLDAFLDRCLDPTYSRLCFQEGPAVMGFAAWWEHGERHVLGLMRAMAGALHAEGLIDVDDLDALTQLLFGCITAAALTLSRSPDPESERVRLRAVVLRIVEGLRPFG
jgi:AcrR family transcriptional regulator